MNDALRIADRATRGRSRPTARGLAKRHLSIIDLSGAHQPITNEDEPIWIVFNGEIYNFQETLAHFLNFPKGSLVTSR